MDSKRRGHSVPACPNLGRRWHGKHAWLWAVVFVGLLAGLTACRAPTGSSSNAGSSSIPGSSAQVSKQGTPRLDAPPSAPTPGPLTWVPVERVVDGDTIDVLVNGQKERIRLIGMNTPETVDPNRPVQCYGPEASAEAKKLLTGQHVWIEPDPSQSNKDVYGRYLRYVWMANGTLYDEFMIRQGYAHEYTYHTRYKYWNAFRAAEREAKDAQRGFWNASTCNGNTTQPEPAS